MMNCIRTFMSQLKGNRSLSGYRSVSMILVCAVALAPSILYGQEGKENGMPPANVIVSEIGSGNIAPHEEFIGTVYYHEVSEVASEVNGIVEEVNFEEGFRSRKGEVLVRLGAELLQKTREATRANHEQVVSDLEKERIDLKRYETLIQEGLLSEQLYDEQRFIVQGLEKRSASLMADVERLDIELEKKIVRAPFSGVVIKKHVERGEWLSPGSAVATLAGNETIDIIVEVPERIIGYLDRDHAVSVRAGGKNVEGTITTVIPRGDISTRTFPVKIRARNSHTLVEGMEAKVTLPSGKPQKTLTVPRDAVIPMFGMNVVFAVMDAQAKMIPVAVAGYDGLNAGVLAEGLSEGMKVVIKGNERLRDGQPVNIQ